jgi:hypothetical protein
MPGKTGLQEYPVKMRQGLKVHHLGDLGDPQVPGDAGLDCTTPTPFAPSICQELSLYKFGSKS